MTRSKLPVTISLTSDGKWVPIEAEDQPHVVHVWAEVIDGRPRVVGLRVEPAFHADGKRLRGKHTVADLVLDKSPIKGWSLSRLAETAMKVQRLDFLGALTESTKPEPGRKYGDDHYEAVAAVALEARQEGVSARQAVAIWGERELPTADKWIKRAKELGYLSGDYRRARRGTDHG